MQNSSAHAALGGISHCRIWRILQIPASEVARCQNADLEPDSVLLKQDHLCSFSITFSHVVAKRGQNLLLGPQCCLWDLENGQDPDCDTLSYKVFTLVMSEIPRWSRGLFLCGVCISARVLWVLQLTPPARDEGKLVALQQ